MMAKNIRRMLAMVMVLCMFVGALPLQALATEGTETTETTETSDEGLTTNVTTTTTTTTDDSGNTTVTVTIEKSTEGTTDDGVTVNREETSQTTTETAADGTVIEQTVTEGSETKEWDEDVQPGQDVPEVKVELIPGETTTGTATEETEVTDENGTTITTTTEREVTGTLKDVEESFVINSDESSLESPVGPEDYEGKGYYDGYQEGENKNYRDGLLNPDIYTKDAFETLIDPKPEEDGYEKGFDMTWTGYGDATDGAVAVFVEELVYLLDENGEIVYENGFPVVDMENSKFVQGQNKKAASEGQETGMVSQSVQFALRHENGEYFYAYCMDAATGVGPEGNKWYNIRNLEDAIESEENPDGYITEEEAGKIRAIATNGYWGTEEGRGSVESLKELLKETYNENDVIKVRYPGSNKAYEYNIYELIDGLMEYEALAATQAAIWTYANDGDVTYTNSKGEILVEGASVIGVLSAYKYNDASGKPGLNEYKPVMDGESDARLQALYQCLLGLDPIYADGELREDSTVIPNENVVTDVALVVHDKVADNANNKDDNTDNDVYNTELNFKLAFVPGENDELYVCLMDENNQIILDENNQPIKKLLASEDSTKQGNDIIKPVNGVYTLTGLKLSENSDFTFDLRLEGTQYLNEGVYIYQAEGGRRESQTLVGLAVGEQKVEVSTKMTISFEVDENNHVVAERTWHDESDPTYTYKEPEENPPVVINEEPEEGPRVYRLGVNDGTVEIPDEEVPLADAPTTGDESGLWIALVLMSAFCLVVINITRKKGKYEAF